VSDQIFSRTLRVPVSVRELFAWHERPGAFERLAPPWQQVRVLAREGGIRDGATVRLEVTTMGLPTRWTVRHRDYIPDAQFVDEMHDGPFARWVHTHGFAARDAHQAELRDEVTYALPLDGLGDLVAGGFVRSTLERTFRYRHAVTAHDLSRHAAFADRPRLRIAVTGATGFIGQQLCAFLTTGGHDVLRIGRGAVRPGIVDVSWDPARGVLDARSLEGVDAVIHLAGAPIAERWTPEHKRAIVDSRVQGTSLIARTVASLAHKPSVLLSGSAIGIYGAHRGDEVLDEQSADGDDFLGTTSRAWEDAARPAEDAGIRVAYLRTGIVVGIAGGALAKQWPLFQAGLGGPLGRGTQYMSPIALDDQIGAMHHVLMDERIRGPVNLVAPTAVTNAEFARQVGAAIGRPAFLPAPAFAAELLFGREMVQATALASQRVRPTVLEAHGFRWAWPTVERMVAFESGRADFVAPTSNG
jgi:uncharacterized protein (TIGR01777 family)